MPQLYVVDRDGLPQREESITVWCAWFSELKNRRVAYTKISHDVAVSTIFLGKPANGYLWETAVLRHGKRTDLVFAASQAEAQANHDEAVDHLSLVPPYQSPEDS